MYVCIVCMRVYITILSSTENYKKDSLAISRASIGALDALSPSQSKAINENHVYHLCCVKAI